MEHKKIIIDTDIGDDVDDSFAIALALKNPLVDIIGITTVFKNCDLRSKIVKAELEAFDRKGVDVVSGLDNPLVVKPRVFPYETINETGKPIITAYNSSYQECADREDAPKYLLEKAKQYPHEISLLAIGPLTNLAVAIKEDPETFKLFKELIIMGGSNTGSKEWNIMCDPHAADIVLKCGLPIKLIPIECTIRCEVKDNHYKKLLNPKTKSEKFLFDMYQAWRKNQTRPCQMHDCLVSQELEKSFCTYEDRYVFSDLSEESFGKTISSEGKNNVKLAIDVDANNFVDHLFEILF